VCHKFFTVSHAIVGQIYGWDNLFGYVELHDAGQDFRALTVQICIDDDSKYFQFQIFLQDTITFEITYFVILSARLKSHIS